MTLQDAAILAVIQGLTEFLPVSSSGHLVFFQNLLGLREPMIAFDVIIHLGTLLSVLIYFWAEVWRMFGESLLFVLRLPRRARSVKADLQEHPSVRLTGFLLLTTLVTAAIGLAFRDTFEWFFQSVAAVGVAWVVMGLILMASPVLQKGSRRLQDMRLRDALWIGLAQAVAILPGISRSGSTILAGMACGLDKKEAARYSFFAAILAIVGAGVLEVREGVILYALHPVPMIAGFLISAAVGYGAIVALFRILAAGRFFVFGVYCLIMGFMALGFGLIVF